MKINCFFILLWFLLGSASAHAAENNVGSHHFPVDQEMRVRVDFWKKVYTEISSQESFVHDPNNLSIIYETIEHKNLSRRSKRNFIKKSKKKWKSKLIVLANKRPQKYTSKDKELLAKIKTQDPKKIIELSRNIRTQQGLRDRYYQGLKRSYRYLPTIKKIFAKANLPEELVYLPHVESSFNSKAYSKVGAAGMWQFMRSTGRLYGLKIGYVIDERRDPIQSTIAASRFLKDNYRTLKTWPLALTAYNHGPASLKRAVRKLNSRDISAIIRGYDGRRFGFASKNFYATFMATVEISQNTQKYFPKAFPSPPMSSDEIVLDKALTAKQISESINVSMELLQTYNLALRPVVFRAHVHIPKGFKLKVPRTAKKQLEERRRKIASLKPSSDNLASASSHVISRGESLYVIAKMYKVTISDLVVLNEISSPSRIYPGMRLKIPNRGNNKSSKKITVASNKKSASSPSRIEKAVKNKPIDINRLKNLFKTKKEETTEENIVSKVTTPSPLATSEERTPDNIAEANLDSYNLQLNEIAANYFEVTVEPGETLGHLAEWARIRASEIRRLNKLSFSQGIRVGQRLKLLLSEKQRQPFQRKRIEYHLGIEEDFYSTFRLTGTKEYRIKRGDSPEEICRKYDIPLWLLRKYQIKNPNLVLYVGKKLTIPLIEPITEASVTPIEAINE